MRGEKPSKAFSFPKILISRNFKNSYVALGLSNLREQNIKQQPGIKRHHKPVLKLMSVLVPGIQKSKESKEIRTSIPKTHWRKLCKCLVFVR